MLRKKPTNKRHGATNNVTQNIPSLAGWIGESNVFRMLVEASLLLRENHGLQIGIFRGQDYANIDGALIIRPGPTYPYGSLSESWNWLSNHDPDEDLKIIPFDVKTNLYSNNTKQPVPFFILVIPEYPDYLCFIPARSYQTLNATHRMTHQAKHQSARLEFRTAGPCQFTFPAMLAPFAVHHSDLPAALTNMVNTILHGGNYVNPSNSVEYHGCTMLGPLRHMSLVFDMKGVTQAASKRKYLIEHKAITRGESLPATNYDALAPEQHWNFLFLQRSNRLTIIPRHYVSSRTSAPTGDTIDLGDPQSGQNFMQVIDKHSDTVKRTLQDKWRDPCISSSQCKATELAHSDQVSTIQGEVQGRKKWNLQVGTQRFILSFTEALNEQCFKLKEHVCIALPDSPCGDLLVVEHYWTDSEYATFRDSRILPVSLVRKSNGPNPRCVLVKLFEPGRQSAFALPICAAQDFIVVAATEPVDIDAAKPVELGNLCLFHSDDTNWFQDYPCVPCHNTSDRQWSYIQKHEATSNSKGASILSACFLNENVNPLKSIHNFIDGSVHRYFCDLFCEAQSRFVTQIYGNRGILQRQWNHGTARQVHTSSSTRDQLFRRVLCTLPPGTQPACPRALRQTLKDKIPEVKESTCLKSAERIRNEAYARIVGESQWGISLNRLVSLSGFSSIVPLSCDHCKDPEDCLFIQPPFFIKQDFKTNKCRGCIRNGVPCTFEQLSVETVEDLAGFEPFRRHVPCNRCWDRVEECDNNALGCQRCFDADEVCEREKCANYDEAGDDSSCRADCNRAHHDDKYENLTEKGRGDGGNWRDIRWQIANEIDNVRIAACQSCWDKGWEEFCDNGGVERGPCTVCREMASGSDGKQQCMRVRCPRWTQCKNQACQLAHIGQGFAFSDLVSQRRKNRQVSNTRLRAMHGIPPVAEAAFAEISLKRGQSSGS
ncbi:hypothetical protein BU24DRAFT_469857 [Aaosphaeria arxii CBS 175.79]|uniref:Uncharacterized protein n=1 Tax=Aaosphaeria arxii CBS 175.79 TaxID=1450172 RepID=A0A6A5Y6C1_9PLEO|nr:uncharacterized protein BU24DRAFT_469857 [Aaosphaeria arxii CBS 175.79]KAF2021105.1 hypothetical protein BU24DRAFT_469857 [Aaosphaeria arxii CBS 175.79]